MEEIKVNDYIEGVEYYGHKTKIIRGWVDSIDIDNKGKMRYNIQADDNWKGYRGTMIFEELGEVLKLTGKPRPIL